MAGFLSFQCIFKLGEQLSEVKNTFPFPKLWHNILNLINQGSHGVQILLILILINGSHFNEPRMEDFQIRF